MRSPVTVASDASTARIAAAVLSSLPVSYAPADDQKPPGLAVITGAGDWPTTVDHALRAGTAAIIVVHPQPASLDLLRQAPGMVILDSIWAGNPAVAEAARHFTAAASDAQLIECRVIIGADRPMAACLMDAAALIRALIGPIERICLVQQDESGFVASGSVAGLSISLSVIHSQALAPHAYVRLLTQDGGVEIAVPHPNTARPAELVVTGPDGARTLPTIWESGHRSAWRRTRSALDTGTSPSDLADFAEDQSVLAGALAALQNNHAS